MERKRRGALLRYRELFEAAADGEIWRRYEPDWARAVYHLYVVRVPDREGSCANWPRRDIGTGIHYPVPLHLQKAYRGLGYGRGTSQ